MKLLVTFIIVAAFALASAASAQVLRPEIRTHGDLNAKWVSAIVGMKVVSPTGTHLGTVKDVVVDGYGRATYAIISYGGMMGLGNRYTAVPWASVAEMLRATGCWWIRRSSNMAPILPDGQPEFVSTSWRRAADNYWRSKVALGPAPVAVPTGPGLAPR